MHRKNIYYGLDHYVAETSTYNRSCPCIEATLSCHEDTAKGRKCILYQRPYAPSRGLWVPWTTNESTVSGWIWTNGVPPSGVTGRDSDRTTRWVVNHLAWPQSNSRQSRQMLLQVWSRPRPTLMRIRGRILTVMPSSKQHQYSQCGEETQVTLISQCGKASI